MHDVNNLLNLRDVNNLLNLIIKLVINIILIIKFVKFKLLFYRLMCNMISPKSGVSLGNFL